MLDKETPRGPSTIFLVDVVSGERRKLTTPPAGFEDGQSAFSPDGRTLAFGRRPSAWPLSDLYVLPLTEALLPAGQAVRLTSDNVFIWGFDWAADGNSLVFTSSRGGVDALWRVSASGDRPVGLTVGGNDALSPSVSRRGGRLAYTYGRANMRLWRTTAPGAPPAQGAPSSPSPVTFSPRWDQQPAFSPDGRRIAWSSTSSGSHQIWVAGSGGEQPVQLTSLDAPGADMPVWSPDGRWIAFRGFRPGPEPDLYVVEAGGGAPRRLSTGAERLSQPSWSSDGRWLFYSSTSDGVGCVWRVPAAGGAPMVVTRPGRWPVAARDGTAIYYVGAEGGIWKSPADGGGAPVLLTSLGRPPVRESPDGRYVYFTDTAGGLWRVAASGGEALRVSNVGARVKWTTSARGIHVLDPDAAGGPAVMFLPHQGAARGAALALGGAPEDYVEPTPSTASALTVSPDGQWLVFLRKDRVDRKIMLVDHFR